MRRLILLVSILAGGGDFCTGLLLLVAPQAALTLMRVPIVHDIVWVQFVGVFVGSVGLSYFYGLRSLAKLQTIFELTTLFRFAAGSFVTIQIFTGHLDRAWLSVPVADFFWAALQIFILRKGFPKND